MNDENEGQSNRPIAKKIAFWFYSRIPYIIIMPHGLLALEWLKGTTKKRWMVGEVKVNMDKGLLPITFI